MAENFREMSVKEKVDYSVFSDAQISRDQIKDWLRKDIQGVYILLSEVLASAEVLEALTEVFWTRYVKFHEEKKAGKANHGNGKEDPDVHG